MARLRAATAMLVAALATVGHPRLVAADERVERVLRLDSGATAVVVPDPLASKVTVTVRIRAGSTTEPPAKAGLAHLVEHVCLRLAHGHDTATVLLRHGAQSNALTQLFETKYSYTGPPETLPVLLWAASGCLWPRTRYVSADIVKREAAAVLVENRGNRDGATPGAMQVPLHIGVGLNGVETDESIAALRSEDVEAHLARWYVPSNIVVGVAGPVDPGKADAAIRRWFGAIPHQQRADAAQTVSPTREVRNLAECGSDSATGWIEVYWLLPGPADRHGPAAAVLGEILAGENTRLLARRLVDELSMASEVDVAIDEHAVASILRVVAAPARSRSALTSRLAEEVAGLAEALTERDVARARASLRRRNAEATLTGAKRMDCLVRGALWGSDPCGDVDSVSLADVRAVAKKWLGSGRVQLCATGEPEGAPGD